MGPHQGGRGGFSNFGIWPAACPSALGVPGVQMDHGITGLAHFRGQDHALALISTNKPPTAPKPYAGSYDNELKGSSLLWSTNDRIPKLGSALLPRSFLWILVSY